MGPRLRRLMIGILALLKPVRLNRSAERALRSGGCTRPWIWCRALGYSSYFGGRGSEDRGNANAVF